MAAACHGPRADIDRWAVVLEAGTGRQTAAAAPLGGVSIQASSAPAFDQDAPDPDVVVNGSTYYAFTTGTTLGNHLQALVDTQGPPSGWGSYNGQTYGSSALPVVPAWEQLDTQTSPGVFSVGRPLAHVLRRLPGRPRGRHRLQLPLGGHCATLTPTTRCSPTVRPSRCCASRSGRVHRSRAPSSTPRPGQAYLVWKSNDGGSTQPAYLWSQQLSADGLSLVGAPRLLVTQDMVDFPFESTIENPDMVYS